MRFRASTFLVVVLFCLGAAAQPPVGEAGGGKPAAGPAEDPAPAPLLPQVKAGPAGDEIHLKTGATLKDLQVLRRSPLGIEVQVTEGVTFFIPRKQVEDIKYDDYEPSRQPPSVQSAEQKQATFFGAKIEPATFEKLNRALPDSCLRSTGRDLVDVLSLISAETGVKIEVSEAVKSLPPADRKWDYVLAPGTTLNSLLQTELPLRFPDLAVAYRYNTLVITTREEAAVQEEPEAQHAPASAE